MGFSVDCFPQYLDYFTLEHLVRIDEALDQLLEFGGLLFIDDSTEHFPGPSAEAVVVECLEFVVVVGEGD